MPVMRARSTTAYFRCLVISPAGRAIWDFRSLPELLKALRDAIKAHRSLYTAGKILHRDISENNIIITDPKEADGFTGMLIDEDLAKEIGSRRSGARHQTGTMEFYGNLSATVCRSHLSARPGVIFLRASMDVRPSRLGKGISMQSNRPTQRKYPDEVVLRQFQVSAGIDGMEARVRALDNDWMNTSW